MVDGIGIGGYRENGGLLVVGRKEGLEGFEVGFERVRKLMESEYGEVV